MFFDVPSRMAVIPWMLILSLALLVAPKVEAQTTNTIFSDGFENGLNGWLVGDNNIDGTPCYWGIVNATFGGESTHGGTNKAYCAATGYSGTVVAANYQPNMSAYLLRTLDLSGYTNATLRFWYLIPSIDSANPPDTALVLVDDAVVWTKTSANPATGGNRPQWAEAVISLQTFVGSSHTLKFLFNSDTQAQGQGMYLDDVLVTDAYTAGPPPANNNFNAPQVLVGAIGTVTGGNGSATFEAGEPVNGFSGTNSVWYRWSAITNGPVTITTAGSGFDTVLCVYTGNSVGGLTPVQCDDNGGTNGTSRVVFTANQATIYRIQVRGANDARGGITLNWSQPAGVGYDLLPDVGLWADQAGGYLYDWYIDRNEPTKPGRTLLRASTASINTGIGALELIGSSLSPGVYQRIYSSDGGYRDVYAGTFTFHPGHGHLHFDNWLNFHLREVLSGNGVGNVVVAGNKTSFAIIDLERYNSSLPGYPADPHYGGGLVQGMSIGWADVYGGVLPDQWIDVTDVSPGRYWLEAVVDPDNRVLESNESNNVVRILIDLPSFSSVPNDHFTNAVVLTGTSTAAIGSNVGATKENLEPEHKPANAGGASIWYRWTAPSNMNVVVSTEGSGFDTVLAIYTGGSVNGLGLVARNDDSGIGSTSLTNFSAVGGVTYRIAVDGYYGEIRVVNGVSEFGVLQGSVQLNINPAWNDDFAKPIQLSGMSGTNGGSSRGATRQANEPLHAGVNGTNSIWYVWTAPTNGPFTFETTGSSFDTLLAVYTGDAFPLTAIASDDNSGALNTSRVNFNAVSNTTYRIAVDGFPGENSIGVVRLKWSGPRPPVILNQPVSTNLIAGATAQFRVNVDGSAPLSYQWRRFGTNLFDDGAHFTGVAGSTLTVGKIFVTDAAGYSVIITNVYGAVTSNPAYLIVVDNPRVVYVNHVTAPIAGNALLPLHAQAVGDERTYKFSMSFDPAVLSNPTVAVGSNTPGASIVMNNSLLASGKLGITLTLADGHSLPQSSLLELARVLFDANPMTPAGTETIIGFLDQPVLKSVVSTNGAILTALFAAGTITLENWNAAASGQFLPNGSFQLSLSGPPNHTYVIETATNVVDRVWTPVSTNQTSAGGVLQFIDTTASNAPQRFFRARMIQ